MCFYIAVIFIIIIINLLLKIIILVLPIKRLFTHINVI